MASLLANVTFIYFLVTMFAILSLVRPQQKPKHSRKISPSDPIIETKNGRVRGILDNFKSKKVSKFLGIPYALPPVGELRFKKSRQLNYTWDVPIIAFDQPNYCFQGVNIAIEQEAGSDGFSEVSEDCLYLNVFAPGLTMANKDDKSKILKPVMIWIHGGSFYGGSVSQPVYNAKALAVIGDIVVVTVGYRLGPFGFLYTGSSNDDAPGNQALWDVLNAVYWVSENIKRFGGDPSKITLAGHGSGAVMVSMAAMSPAFDQLLSSWIIMSGSALGKAVEPKTVSKVRAHRLAYQLGCSSEDNLYNDCFKYADAHLLSLVAQSRMIAPSFDTRIYNYFNVIPQYGDTLVPMNPAELIKLYPKTKRILIGATDFEGAPLLGQKELLALDPRLSRITWSDRESTWKSGLRDWVGRDIIKVNETTKDLLVDYYLGQSRYKNRKNWAYEVLQFWGDHNILCPIRIQAKMMADNLNDVFLYRFSHINNFTTPMTHCKGLNLSCHGMEVHLLFARPFLQPTQFDVEDKIASQEMIDIFTGFMRGEAVFPKITLANDGAYTFGSRIPQERKTTYAWNKDICNLLKPFILVDDELEQKVAADSVGMQIIQSPFGIPGRVTNKLFGLVISFADRVGYSALPWGRYVMEQYRNLAKQLNQAPSLTELYQTILSYTGLTGMI